MGQTPSTISGSSSTKPTTSSVQTESKHERKGYLKLEEATESFSDSIEYLSGHKGEEPSLRGTLDFDAYATSEDRKKAEKKRLMAQSCPPDIRHDQPETKPKASHGKRKQSHSCRHITTLPFDPSRLGEFETLLRKKLSEGTETQYAISFHRSKQNTVLVKFTTRQKSTLVRQKPELDKAVTSALEAMSSEKCTIVTYPANIKKYALDNVPYGSKLAGTVASIAERILQDVDVRCKVTQHNEKGLVGYKVSRSDNKFDVRGMSVPATLKADIFIALNLWSNSRQEKGKSQDDIASNSTEVARIEKVIREWLSDKYELDLVKAPEGNLT
jgi:hypothetical protein